MKRGWTVTIEGRAAKALDELDPEDLGEELADIHAVVSLQDGLLSATATVDADGYRLALDHVYEALAGAIGARLDVERAEAMTEERQVADLEISNLPDLVGLTEIAELAGTTRQRVFQMTANKGFPAALLELKSGRLWSRPAIQSYLEARETARGPKLKVLSSPVRGRDTRAAFRKRVRPAAMKKR
jgi:hypothetical protein